MCRAKYKNDWHTGILSSGLFTFCNLSPELHCWVAPGLRKTRFFQKNNPDFFKKKHFFVFFWKKQEFVLFLRKTEKPHSEFSFFHHAISLSSELYINNLLYLLWHSKLRVKKCAESLFSQSVVGQFTLSDRTVTRGRAEVFAHHGKMCWT